MQNLCVLNIEHLLADIYFDFELSICMAGEQRLASLLVAKA